MNVPRWVLAVDHGTTVTHGATGEIDPADGWVRVGTVAVGGVTSVPSVVLSRSDGVVLAGAAALEAGRENPEAAVLRARPHLGADGGAAQVLTTVGRETTAVDVATAMVATVLQAEYARRGSPPAATALLHPHGWSPAARAALRRAGRDALAAVGVDAGDGDPEGAAEDPLVLVPGAVAAAHRAGTQAPVAVVDLGGGGTEAVVVAPGGEVLASRTVPVGGEALDDALAALVLDRARPDLAARIRYEGDREAHRAWYALRVGVRDAKETLGTWGRAEVPLPGAPGVTLTHDDLARLLAPGLDQVAAGIESLCADPAVTARERPRLLVRGGLAGLPQVRDWLARRTGLTPVGGGAAVVGPHGPVSGAAARLAADRL